MSSIPAIVTAAADFPEVEDGFSKKLEKRHTQLWRKINAMCEQIVAHHNGDLLPMATQNVQAEEDAVDWKNPTTEEMSWGDVTIQRFCANRGLKASVTHTPLSAVDATPPSSLEYGGVPTSGCPSPLREKLLPKPSTSWKSRRRTG